MSQYESLGYAYTIYPIVKRQRWMSEAHPIGRSKPHEDSYQMEGEYVDDSLNYQHKYSHYHSNQRGMCRIHADCPSDTLCVNGSCADKCLYNGDCPLGTECKQGYCRVEFCKSDNETSSGMCNVQLHNKDEPHRAMLRECDVDTDCDTGNCQRTQNGKFCGRPKNSDPIQMWRKYKALYGLNKI